MAPGPFDPDVLAYYEQGSEDGRLRGDGPGSAGARLEFLRTRDVLRRVLPAPPARVLDVGGGSGVHAEWLAADGYEVDLIEPVPLHVEQAARLPGVTARAGDARDLPCPDASYDAVLALGPLYHLPERADRVRALAEARRAVRPGGPVAAAAISRYRGLHEMLRTGRYFDPGVRAAMDRAVADGVWAGATLGLFTTAYLHLPEEIAGEFHDAGLADPVSRGLEGAVWLTAGADALLDDPGRRAAVLEVLRAVETAPSLIGASGHILTTAVRLGRIAGASG